MVHCNPENTKRLILQRKLVFFVLGSLSLVVNSCQRNSESHREVAAPVAPKVVAPESKQVLPHCPDAPYRMLQAKEPATGHHRVFLKWNASKSASGSDSRELGYCLYRTQMPGRAKNCPKKYRKCEQVNVVPVSGTRCVDELVKDDTTYYYVAIAITSTDTSSASEEAIAEVPAGGKRKPPPPRADSYPVCRVPIAASQ